MASLVKRGNTYHLVWREKGRQKWLAVGSNKRLADERKRELEQGVLLARLGLKNELQEINFEVFVKKYLRDFSPNKSASTRLRDDYTLKHLNESFFGRLLTKITSHDVEAYKSRRLKKVSASTVNRELSLLKSILTRAVEWGYLIKSPAKSVKLYKIPKRKPNFLTWDEAKRVIETAEGQMKVFIAIGVHTGLRKVEILSLKWDDISFERRELKVIGKGGDEEVIPLTNTLYDILHQHPRHIKSNLVLYAPSGGQWKDLRGGFKKALNKAGIDRHIRIHDLRHTFVSNLFEAGAGKDPRSVMDLARHKDINTTMQYAHTTKGRLRDSIEMLDGDPMRKSVQ